MTFIQTLRNQRWMTLLILAALLVSTFAGYYGLWGLLFIFWGLLAVRSGQAFLIEPINRATDPALFWSLTGLWTGLGVLYVLADVFPPVANGF